MLSCDCSGIYEAEPGDWYWLQPKDFSIFNRKNRKKCKSCSGKIEIGAHCLEFERFRVSKTDIEIRIRGGEYQIATYYLCEKCGEIFLNLSAAGFCLQFEENMNDVLREYHKLTGFKHPDGN